MSREALTNSKIFFSADLHIGHHNVLKYMSARPYASEQDTKAHDEWLIGLWQNTVGKHDRIYIAGDMTFYKSDDVQRLLSKLPGEKYLALGNHDGSIMANLNYFRKVAQIMEITVKPSVCDFLPENMHIVLCHYPLLDWPGKHQGAVMLHGHCHGTMDDYNSQSADLRFDIGIDGALAKRTGGFIDVETLYKAVMEKTHGETIQNYIAKITN